MTGPLERRVAQLEKTTLPAGLPVFWVLVPALNGVTDEAAIENYRVEHPYVPTPTQWVILRGVSPNHEGTS
jgi:hypothetical protein